MKPLLGLALSLTLLVGCASTRTKYDYAKEPDPRKKEYVIGVSDVVKINVWKMPELSAETKVRPDGTITMPLLGDVAVAGKAPSQVKQDITQKLATFVKDETATVTVAIVEVNSYRFVVSGNVERPGVFSSKQFVTVAEAIALAGGPNKFASIGDIVVIRPDLPGGKVRKLPIDYAEIRSGDRPDENLVILAGDTVYIP